MATILKRVPAKFAQGIATASVIFVLLVSAKALWAQSVHGVVRESGTEHPIEGAVVSLIDADGSQRSGIITGAGGRFVLSAPAPGTYRVRAERIGYRSVLSPPLSLSAGQRLEHDLSAPTEAIQLSGIEVEADRRCVVRPAEGLRAAALWDEARKALSAAAVTQDQALVRYRIRRYHRDLDPKTLTVSAESATVRVGYGSHPFESPPATELARSGYRVEENGAHVYHAPGAHVLLSNEFLDTHCFRLRTGEGEEEGLVGLAFEPVGRRRVVDIRGVLWLDPSTAQLRHVEFDYTGVPAPPASAHGGRVEYERLPTGAWIVRRWWIRAPRLGREPGQAQARIISVREIGGEVDHISTATGAVISERVRPDLSGTVFDSIAGAPLTGATVYLSGTSYSATTDSLGAFRMENMPEGEYAAGFLHPRLDSLGLVLPPRTVSLADGQSATADLAIPSLRSVLAAACSQRAVAEHGVLVGVITRHGSGNVGMNVGVTLTWKDTTGVPRSLSTAADRQGRYRFCAAPAGIPVQVSAGIGGLRARPRSVSLTSAEPTRVDLELAPARAGGLADAASAAGAVVSGRVVDAVSGAPVSGAVVVLDGAEQGQATDARGAFRLQAPAAGAYVISVRHLGYERSSSEVELVAGNNEVEVRIPPGAVELEGIKVTVLSRTELAERARTTSRHAIAGATLREFSVRGARVEDLLRARFPVTIRQLQVGGQPMPGLCVEAGRGPNTITNPNDRGSSGAGCDMIQVVVDGVMISDPGLLLRNLSLAEFDSVELLSPVEAGIRWGSRSGSGVLVLTTRRR